MEPKNPTAAPAGAPDIRAQLEELAAAVRTLNATGLNRRAILLLLNDATGIGKKDIGEILDAIPNLVQWYTTKKVAAKSRPGQANS